MNVAHAGETELGSAPEDDAVIRPLTAVVAAAMQVAEVAAALAVSGAGLTAGVSPAGRRPNVEGRGIAGRR